MPPLHPLAGDIGFDPLGLKPAGYLERREMEAKELNNGRLAMIGILGMTARENRLISSPWAPTLCDLSDCRTAAVAEELATGDRLF